MHLEIPVLKEWEANPKERVGICPPNVDYVHLNLSDDHQKNYSYLYLRVVKITYIFSKGTASNQIKENLKEKKEVGKFIFPKLSS